MDGNTASTLVDFGYLKSEIASATPTGSLMASYSPSNSPQACPTNAVNFTAAASPLPPTPDTSLCECMYSSLGCVVAADVSSDDYGSLFDYVCSRGDGSLCDGIEHNGTTGQYGQFGMCNPQQQLGYVLNQYYVSLKSSASACSFSGSAVTQAAASATGSCAAALSSASSAGGSSGGSGGAASSTSKGAGATRGVFGGDLGLIFGAIFAQVALVSGIGMLLL